MTSFRALSVAMLLGVAVAGAPALAHPKVVSATPAANAVVATPKNIQLHFNEKLVPKFSGAELVMTGMPGMKDHAPMKVAGKAAVAADGRTLIVTPGKPLATGQYSVNWHVVSADTHRVTGSHSFSIK